MLSDVVERLSDEGDGRLAASTLTVGLARLLQRGRVFPRQTLRRAQLGLNPLTGHGKSFIQRCRDCGQSGKKRLDRSCHTYIPPKG